jgi:hypothetical protein
MLAPWYDGWNPSLSLTIRFEDAGLLNKRLKKRRSLPIATA